MSSLVLSYFKELKLNPTFTYRIKSKIDQVQFSKINNKEIHTVSLFLENFAE